MDVNPQTESSGPTDPQTYSGLIGQDFNPQTESSGEFDVESSERRTLHQVMWEMPCREAVRPLGRMEFLGGSRDGVKLLEGHGDSSGTPYPRMGP